MKNKINNGVIGLQSIIKSNAIDKRAKDIVDVVDIFSNQKYQHALQGSSVNAVFAGWNLAEDIINNKLNDVDNIDLDIESLGDSLNELSNMDKEKKGVMCHE